VLKASSYFRPAASIKHDRPSVNRPRPWLRFWARSIDMLLYTQLNAWLLISFIVLSQKSMSGLFIGAVLFLIIEFGGWIFIEAAFLSFFGSSFGHWLFKTKVRNQDGSRLTYKQALKRSAWILCVGLGFNVLAPITYLIAYFDLNRKRQSFWDRRGGHVVSTPNLSPVYIVGSLAIALSINILLQFLIQISPLKAWQNELNRNNLSQNEQPGHVF
jgi:uncharacterized RDD family membrane protein YckC